MIYSHNPMNRWTHTGSSTPYDNEADDTYEAACRAFDLEMAEIRKMIAERLKPFEERFEAVGGEISIPDIINPLHDDLYDHVHDLREN